MSRMRDALRSVGQRFVNKDGDWVTLVRDVDYKRVEIIFDSGSKDILQFNHVKAGTFKYWNKPTIYGVGCVGYPSNNKPRNEKQYSRWHAMLSRCYDETNSRYDFYKDVDVCESWHKFCNFSDWCDGEKYSEDVGWHLDKDLLAGGKGYIYSPETCVFVPQEINVAIINDRLGKGKFKSIGVYFDKQCGEIVARIKCGSLGLVRKKFTNEQDAAMFYKQEKEKYVKYLAEKWKSELSTVAYEALLSWEVPLCFKED
jgi:hypothetical protein